MPEQNNRKHSGTPLEKEEKKKIQKRKTGEPFYAPPDREVVLMPQKTTTQKPKKSHGEVIFSPPAEKDIIQQFDFSHQHDQIELKESSFAPPPVEKDVIQPYGFPQEEDPVFAESDNISGFPLANDFYDVINPEFMPPQVKQPKVSRFKAQQQKLKQQRNEK